MKVRLVVMVPTIVEAEYLGDMDGLADWSRQYVRNHFHKAVPSACDPNRGPVGDLYIAKLMESAKIDDLLDDMIAPGLVA